MNDHILSTYDDELKQIRSIVIKMGDFAANQLSEAMQALRDLDDEKAKAVQLSDTELDAMEITAERAVVGVFARRAPVADDLREVVSVLKITTMIERMGDYAKNIAKSTAAISEGTLVVMPQLLDDMANEAHRMIQNILEAYIKRSAQDALAVWESDETLDSLYNLSYRKILARMMETPEHIGALTHYLMIAKNLERIGDQATNIAEQIYYAITGDNLEEARSKNRESSIRPTT